MDECILEETRDAIKPFLFMYNRKMVLSPRFFDFTSQFESSVNGADTTSIGSFQATLAETPAIRAMTDKQLANASSSGNGDSHATEDHQVLEDVLISHLSPSRKSSSHSETSSPSQLGDHSKECDDGLHAVPLGHPGIAQSSVSSENAY